MRLISAYAPPTFLKPCVIISTVYGEIMKETAISWVNALNSSHALSAVFTTREKQVNGNPQIATIYENNNLFPTNFRRIQEHKSEEEAINYHLELIKKLPEGSDEKTWNESFDFYLEFYDKYCPEIFKEKEIF